MMQNNTYLTTNTKNMKKELTPAFYPKLFGFLKANNLKISGDFTSTDLYCAYKVCHEKWHYDSDKIDDALYPYVLPFFYNTYDDVEFNPECTLDNYSINEDEFIKHIQKILDDLNNRSDYDIVMTVIYGNWNQTVYKKILDRNDIYSHILYTMASGLKGTRAGQYAIKKLSGVELTTKEMLAISYLFANEIADSYRIVKSCERAKQYLSTH